jgi:hypothetical protein
MTPYTPPAFKSSAFNCPHCGAYSNHFWSGAHYYSNGYGDIPDLDYCLCLHCKKYSVWHLQKMIYPSTGGAALPNNDLPDDVRTDYEEARTILNQSPREATALLRLAIQKLCIHLGEKGKNINEDIKNLVQKGLPAKVQQSLDIVRVIGNNAVHPGQIDLTDDTESASKLFVLVNIIAEVMITQPKEVDKLFNSLPANQLAGIKQRDGK